MAKNEAQGEQMLPNSWAQTSVKEVYNIVGGGTPSTKIEEYWQGDIPWISSADIHGPTDIRPRRRITKDAVENSATNLVPAGSLIVVTRVGLGKVALTNSPICFSQDSQALVGSGDFVLPDYAIHYLTQAVQVFKYRSRGTTIAGVTKKQLANLPFALPPLPEQSRIVAKIETHFTRLDAGVAALERTRANLRRYRAAVLKAACEGRLVPTEAELARVEGREYELADQLLDRILAERRVKWEAEHPGKKHKEPAPPDTEDLPELPEGWAYSLIEPLLSTSRSGMKTGPFGSLLKKHEHKPEGIPVLGIENIGPTSYVPGNRIFITEEKADQLSKYDVQPNDILISRSGTVGEVCIVPEGLGNARFSTNLMRVVLAPDSMLPKFFRFLFNGSPFVLDQVSDLCSGSTRDFLNQKILKSIVFPLPPLAEQRRIVAEVERRLSVVAALEREVEAALARARRLRQAVLKQAFEGRLVDQDPDDEPAAALLERIRAKHVRPKTRSGGKDRRERKQPHQLELL